MSTISFGAQPFAFVVNLSPDAYFVQTLTNQTGWADGVSIEMRFISSFGSPIVWAATVSGQSATWIEDTTAVGTVIDTQPSQVRLHYIDGSGDDLLWAVGRVNVLS